MVTKTDSGDKANPRAIPINPDLVWDYDIPPAAEQSEVFRRWYLARVLTRGRSSDLRAIGFDTIYSYLPSLNLPAEIRSFWEWYFNLAETKQRYGDTHSSTAPDAGRNRPEPASR